METFKVSIHVRGDSGATLQYDSLLTTMKQCSTASRFLIPIVSRRCMYPSALRREASKAKLRRRTRVPSAEPEDEDEDEDTQQWSPKFKLYVGYNPAIRESENQITQLKIFTFSLP